MNPISGFTRGTVALAGALLLLAATGCATNGEHPNGEPPDAAASGARATGAGGWSADFSQPATVSALGNYRTSDGQTFELETLSALLIEPSRTATYSFRAADAGRRRARGVPANELVVEDPNPAVRPAPPGSARWYERAEGAISAIGWVNQFFTDVRVTGIVNTAGGKDGAKAESRQGLLGRWDLGTNYYWFNVDFAKGVYEIDRASFFALQSPMEGSVGPVKGFDATKPYWLEFELVGTKLRGRVYEVRNGQRGGLVGDTGDVTEKDVIPQGVSGILTEPTDAAPFTPLRGSFARVSSTALRGQPTKPAAEAAAGAAAPPQPGPRVAEARAQANRKQYKEAVATYQAALAANRQDVVAMRELAWVRATATDAEVRNPQEALTLANQSLDVLIENVKAGRRAGQVVVGKEAIPFLTQLLRSGQSIAAALGAQGKFVGAPQPQVERMIQELGAERLAERDLTLEMARVSAGDSGELSMQQTADWTVAFARQINQLAPTQESAHLLQTSEQIKSAALANRTLDGMPIP